MTGRVYGTERVHGDRESGHNICSSYIALYPQTSSKRFEYILLPPGTPVHTNTFSTPQWSIQPGYMLQGAVGDQCTIAFSVYCHVLIYGWVNRSTFRVQILPKDSRYRRLSVRRDSNPWFRGWESNALTTQPTVLPKTSWGVHGDRESTWGLGEYMGTGRVLMYDIGSLTFRVDLMLNKFMLPSLVTQCSIQHYPVLFSLCSPFHHVQLTRPCNSLELGISNYVLTDTV